MLTKEAVSALGYDLKHSVDGLAMYYLEGNRIRKSQVPKDVVDYFATLTNPEAAATNASVANAPTQRAPEQVKKIQQRELTPESGPKICVFCGEPAESARFVNGQLAQLCYEHYQTTTVGQLVEKLRENDANKQNREVPVPENQQTSGNAISDRTGPLLDPASSEPVSAE